MSKVQIIRYEFNNTQEELKKVPPLAQELKALVLARFNLLISMIK